MKRQLSKVLWVIGKFFFWLLLLMISLSIIELVAFPHLTTISEVRNFFSEGGWCYISGNAIAEVTCEEKATTETPQLIIEKILNVPLLYSSAQIITPFATLDSLQLLLSSTTPPGRREINSFNDLSWIVKISPLWFLSIISIIYYIWKSGVNVIKKIRNRQNRF